MTLAALFMATAGAWAQSANTDTVNAAPVPNQANKWSFRMPAGDVEVLVKYKTPTTLSLTYYGAEINTEDPVGMALTANFNGEAAFKQSLVATVTANNEAVANLPVTYTSDSTEVIAFGDNHAASGALADIRFLSTSTEPVTLTAQFTGNDSLASSNAVSVPVQILEPIATYTVALAANTEDADNWQAKVGNAEEFSGLPLQGVAEDDSVTVKYTGTREVSRIEVVEKATPARPLAEATADDLGKIVGANGNIYDTQLAASNAGTTAVAMIAYVGNATGHTTYTRGLAIALSDEGSMVWSTAKSTCEGKTPITDAAWLLPSEDQWKTMFSAYGGNNASCTGLNTAITNAEGTALQVGQNYWSSSESDGGSSQSGPSSSIQLGPTITIKYFIYLTLANNGTVTWENTQYTDDTRYVRAALAF